MNAHPMITPLTATSPDTIAATYPPDAAALYRLLWDTTLAHLKGPPTWQRTRIVFGDPAEPVAMDWDRLQTPGWLAVHTAPAHDVSLMSTNMGKPETVLSLEHCTYSVVADDDASRSCRVDVLLQWIDELQIASPGRMATLLETLIDAGYLKIDDGRATVTAAGNAQLGRAEAAGFHLSGFTVAQWRVACDDYASGAMPLEALASQADRLLGVSIGDAVAPLEALVLHGHAANDAYALRNQDAVRPPVITGYPRTMDPELCLRSDDPLRVQREDLENALTRGREQRWAFLPADERVAIRLGYLATTTSEEAVAKLMDDVRFDVRVRWLVGLSLAGNAPDNERAKSAFNAWTHST